MSTTALFRLEVYPTQRAALEALAGEDRVREPVRGASERLRAEDVGAVTVIRPPGAWGMSWEMQEEIAEEIKGLVRERGRHRLVLDLAEVPAGHSGFVTALIGVGRAVAAANGTLALCGLSEAMAEVLRVCALPMEEHGT
ncbi:MAG: STAS domain-containing protein [Gemmataceae bacterium]|nr:STAS domain-containing protein [Gemmataceae bacterium]